MIKVGFVYLLAGVMFAVFAVFSALDRNNAKRFGNAAFWGLVAVSFLLGDRIGDLANGVLVLALAVIAGFGLLGRGAPATTSPAERRSLAERFGNRLFVPALVLPAVIALGVVVVKPLSLGGQPIMDPKQATLISMGVAAVLGVATALYMLRQPPLSPFQEGRRIVDTVGWAVLLPQMLAALGVVFEHAGVGKAVGHVVTTYLPMDSKAAAVAVYCVGMALFTGVMGNAFAAFPVLTAGVALPILVGRFGANPAVVASIGMLSGYCGTLVTPLAANFNLVPPALLELPDRYAVIKAQIPTAILMLLANTVLMYVLAFR
jgi:uncharacterized membrane protein